MKTKKIIVIAVMLMVTILTSFVSAGEIKHITIGTASIGGMNYPIGMALARIWNANVPGVKAVAIATSGAPHNIDLLRTNDIDAAVCRAIEADKAINGVAPYPEKMPWIRAIQVDYSMMQIK